MEGVSYANELIERISQVKCSLDTESRRKKMIHRTFEECMIAELQSLIKTEVYNDCWGCQVDHPSQKHHHCLNGEDEKTEMFLYQAVGKLDPYDIMKQWYPMLKKIEDEDVLEVYRLWKSIKDKNQLKRDESWLAYWTEKVKNAWKQ